MKSELYYVYVLRSLKNNKRYIGYTKKNIELRLQEHNNGCNKWTKNNGPFKIVYFEKYQTKTGAIKREHLLKSGFGRKLLDKITGCGAVG